MLERRALSPEAGVGCRMLGPGERVDLWTDFSNPPLGLQTALVSQAFDEGMMRNYLVEKGGVV